MKLSRRLMVLILLCLLPMVVATLITLAALYRDRSAQLSGLARRQVDVAGVDLTSVLDGARGLLLTLGQLPSAPDCPTRLAALQDSLPAYRFLAVSEPSGSDGQGRAVCASNGEFAEALSRRPDWLARVEAGPGFHVGRYAAPAYPGTERQGHAFLPLVLRLPTEDGAERLLVAGLDLHWLGSHFGALQAVAHALLPNSSLAVLDGDGTILARVPDFDRSKGTPVRAETKRFRGQADPDPAVIPGLDQRDRLVALSLAGTLPGGLAVAVGLDPEAFLADVQDAVTRVAALGIVATALALLIASTAARGVIQKPAGRLLAAAKRWSAGDLAARADMRGDRSEFGFLGGAFNQMAADIEARVAALSQQAQQLEARVAERTRELSDSNNRLQVEIAERRRAETVMHQAQKLQAVGQLAGGLAHDFNNLLATILGSLELIERRVTTKDDKLQTLLTRATEAVQRGSQLTSRLLAFSRRQRLAARPTDVNRLVTDLVALAGSSLGRRVRIKTDLPPDLWPAMADTSQLEAAILNLALNARDAMPEGGVLTFSTDNETVGEPASDVEPGDYVRITVEDTGTGMSSETLGRAFEPFFTTKELGKGSGLGLSQVYGVARQSGGTVRIRSEPGKGTAVALLMPRATESAAATAAGPSPPARGRSRAGLVLLVDDDPDVRQVNVEMLRDLGYEVVEAADGEEALDVVRRLPASPALLVLDYAMPGMNGLRLAAALRGLGITAPLLLATGYAELSNDPSGVRPDAILHKPFSLAELDRTLGRIRVPATEAV